MSNVRIIETDLLNLNCDIICQQVNCQGVMGAGLAKTIKTKYPEVFWEYLNFCDIFKYDGDLLGRCEIIKLQNTDDYSPKYVANLFGQQFYGRDKKQYTIYNALENALIEMRQWLSEHVEKDKIIVGIPYNIGCGLAGGNWNFVYDIIKKVFSNHDKFEIIICKKL